MTDAPNRQIPVLLLKTKSSPADGYEDHFSSVDNGRYKPTFVPVLEHQFKQDALDQIRVGINAGFFNPQSQPKYGGLIFTSQRAVEAFTQVVEELRQQSCPIDELVPEQLQLYVVGPATGRSLRALDLSCPISGEETGNGEALAAFMLEHYNQKQTELVSQGKLHEKLPLLFFVGEKRRDIIPKTLQSHDLPLEKRIGIEELTVYETVEMQSFRSSFESIWKRNVQDGHGTQWVVVFSPTGCKAFLETLGYVDKDVGQANPLTFTGVTDKIKDTGMKDSKTLIATIGPTTRDYLRTQFSIEPDVCAEHPSPEGIGAVIQTYMLRS